MLLLALPLFFAMVTSSALARPAENSGENSSIDTFIGATPGPDKKIEPDGVIVKFKEEVDVKARSDVRRGEDLDKTEDLDLIDAEVDKVNGQSVEQTVRDLESRPDVEYAEPDYYLRSTGYADEPRFGELWGLHNTGQVIGGASAGTEDVDVNALEASTVTQGDPNLVVAVIDDGVDFSHPDLAGREWTNPGESGDGKETNGVDDDGNGRVDDVNGWDFRNNDNSVHDADDFHGTHVSGTIAASVNGQGTVGVAPNIKIMALKFLGSSGGSTSDAVLAIEYAKSKGAKISNNSWGGVHYSQALAEAIDASGMLFVASAGNSGLDTDALPHYPSSYTSPNILSVTALNNQGELAGFSNYGRDSIDVAAPGVGILSSIPGASWEFFSGTSAATPYATGAAALVASDSPELLSDPAALKQVLMDTGKRDPDTAGKTVTGKMVDARAALTPRVTAVAPKPGARRVSPATNVTATFSENMLPSSINAETLTLARSGSSPPVAAVVTYDPATRKATLDANRRLRRGVTYTAKLSTGVEDVRGDTLMSRKKWRFAVDPPPG